MRDTKDPMIRGTAATAADGSGASGLESLLTYPSLARLFETQDSKALDDMRSRLERTRQSLERVVRQGPSADSTRAARILSAYDLTLSLLQELEDGMRSLRKDATSGETGR
jgi:hypothetical protein